MKATTFHPLSALVLIALDLLFSGPEIILPFTIPVTVILAFASCTIAVTLTQRFLAGEQWGESFAKGFALGILAGVPYPVLGTGAGTILFGWSGLDHLLSRSK